ncbi:glycosyltransferase [Alicyclobacillus fastidiosus]|uniref:Glycosyltransferase family 2 protein n=1 Tax=Alicyclobacillus fastidiosus TaxID=392011 RepID=A0ABV5AEV7_9BACL|nr:glycosyltransferase family 2 protein [Alicyclobacillus fastidiosus]WEH09565.1 glycosyltransferase family 2 protein [Alicyclobacillus fastidiosus]
MISIVVPTYNEKDNVRSVAEIIKQTLCGHDYELIFVDDSTDETPLILEQLSEADEAVRYLHRDRERGLATAVARGFEISRGDVVTVMDADLQHPPAMIVTMYETLKQADADFVIPSRFVCGGDDGGLNIYRKMVSFVARYVGKLLLPVSLRKISDPTGGFFMFRREVIHEIELKPVGWKILIEVLVRGTPTKVVEVPYRFQPRNAGQSKMSTKEQINYVRHLLKLLKDSPSDRRLYLFCLIGFSGVIVNMILYSILVRVGFGVPLSGCISAAFAMASNFALNDRVTWADVKGKRLIERAIKYVLTSVAGIGISTGTLTLLYYDAHVHYLDSNLIGISVATVWNFIVNNIWTWRRTEVERGIVHISLSERV